MRVHRSAACGSHKGNIRENNEDAVYFQGKILSRAEDGIQILTNRSRFPGSSCYAVFDGMGGEDCGEVAAITAAQRMGKFWRFVGKYGRETERFLLDACEEMNIAVCRESQTMGIRRMGTTAALLLLTPWESVLCNIGDSRIYRLREDELIQLSVDHVMPQMGGGIPRKMPLTQHLGIFPEELKLEPYLRKEPLHRGDCFLMCSDGLTDMVREKEIKMWMQMKRTPRERVEGLIRTALGNGGKDNVTAIIVDIH